MRTYRAIIFDLDGVICSTDQYHYQAWSKLADDEGIYFDEEINNRLRGVSRMESLEIILERSNKSYTKIEKEQLAERKNNIYVEYLSNIDSTDLSQDVKDTLFALRKRGKKLAIGSSSKNAKLILAQLGLSDFFDTISDGTNIINSKPDPEVFLKAAEYLGVMPVDCLVVEDAKAGILAAHNGGFDSAGIGEAKESEYTTYSINQFSELLNYT